MFGLFLIVLLGISALAVDYAGWLLTDRSLQNISDHAALAGADAFDTRTSQGSCSGPSGAAQCAAGRAQAWASLNNDIPLGLDPAIVTCLSAADSPPAGETDSSRAAGCTALPVVQFRHTIWVSTPPPNAARYTNYGGRYASNFGVVWVRVDRAVRSLLGGAIGITPKPRTGWSTAGDLPTDYALETFCRNSIAPESGVCVNSSGVTIDGQGGIRLLRGDIGSNESLVVSAATGNGVILEAGNMFLVNGTCSSGSWGCPGNAHDPFGGIVNNDPSVSGATMKNAFYIPPVPVPQFQSPIDSTTVSSATCSGADATHLCVPYRDQSNSTPSAPGDWTCQTTGSINRCGIPSVTVGTPSTVSCVGQGGGNPLTHYYPIDISSGASSMNGDPAHAPYPAHPQSNANEYKNIDDDFVAGDPDTASPTPANPSVDYLYTNNISTTGSASVTFIATLGQSGPRLGGSSTVRYVGFKTNNGLKDNTQNPVTLTVRLLPGSGSTAIAVDPTPRVLTDVPTRYEFTVGAGVIPASQFNSLRLEFTFTTSGSSTSANQRGGAIAWAEIEHPPAQPPVAPMIPPGYYHSIIVPSGSCMILDPTAEYSSLKNYQMPGIYRFGGPGGNNGKEIQLGSNAYLIGDGVTLVFDSNWPDSGSNQGIALGSNSAFILNTMRVPGVPPCTPSETETISINQSDPYLGALPYSAVCAAWAVDVRMTAGIRPGQNAWHYCDPTNPDSGSHCVERGSPGSPTPGYNPATQYRGITFYFTPDPGWSTAHASMNIRDRFQMQGTSAGIAFRGVLYAPYDDVTITGGNGFSTVGQVLSWSVKFNGGSAFIDLDYPYDFTPAAPYLLEPTVNH
jgi:hypothetical protein